MEKTDKNTRSYQRRSRAVFAISGGITAALVVAETLLSALSALSAARPESAMHAVNTYILGADGYRLTAFLIAALTVFLAYRNMRLSENGTAFRPSLVCLSVREGTVVLTAVIQLILRLLGIDGGVNPLVPIDGYLIRMIGPLAGVISSAVIGVFSVAYVCAYLFALADEKEG